LLLRDCIDDEGLAVELAQAYDGLRDKVAAMIDGFAPESMTVLAANTYRLNLPLEGMWRFPMDVAIDQTVRENPNRIGQFIEEFIGCWGPLVQRLEKHTVSTAGWLTQVPAHLTEDLKIKMTSDGPDGHELLSMLCRSLTLPNATRLRAESFIESLRSQCA
jgi:hypothetical protein